METSRSTRAVGARGEVAGMEPFLFMSVATLLAAMVFTGRGLERVERWFLIANGLLLPTAGPAYAGGTVVVSVTTT